ncbi:MAG: hypothetical protein KDE67_08265 [Sphingobium sp.]|jgi:hypothetical protein|nr:hypothetical protein [Sphingobium sp.]
MNEPTNPIHEHDPTSSPEATNDKLTIQFDAREYAHFLADLDLTEAQKLEYIETLWTIVLHFIDMGFGIHPIQQACGQFSENLALCPDADSDVVKSLHSHLCNDFESAGECLCIEGILNKKEEEETP